MFTEIYKYNRTRIHSLLVAVLMKNQNCRTIHFYDPIQGVSVFPDQMLSIFSKAQDTKKLSCIYNVSLKASLIGYNKTTILYS